MNGNGQVQHVKAKCLRFAGAKNVHICRRTELFDQLARGIMIAIYEIDIDPGLFQPYHLSIEKQRRLKALQANVVQVTGNDDKVNLVGQRRVQQLFKGAPCRVTNFIDRGPRIVHKSLERGVEVDIGSVNELHPKALQNLLSLTNCYSRGMLGEVTNVPNSTHSRLLPWLQPEDLGQTKKVVMG